MPRFTSTKSFEQIKRPRKLHLRSNLGIEFPQTDGRVFRTYIPFLQNPIITERGQANLNEYEILGRPGAMYSYGGAKSRQVSLQFKINLLHVLYTDSTEGIDTKFLRQFNLFYADKERAKKAFQLKPGGEYEARQRVASEALEVAEAAERRSRAAQDDLDYLNSMGFEYLSIAAQSDPSFNFRNDIGFLNDESVFEDPVAFRELVQRTATSSKALASNANKELAAANQSLNKLATSIGQDFMDYNKNSSPDIQLGAGFPHAETHRGFYREAIGIMTGGATAQDTPIFDEFANYLVDTINKAPLDAYGDAQANTVPTPKEQLNRLNKLLNAVYVWVNLVRATTMNRSDNTTFGPPVVRLTHGPMYNNVPFVVSDYDISINDVAGYDVETLTPRELQITMNLKEIRTNGNFKESQIEEGDHVAGWEAIIGNNNIDPYNGDITQKDSELETYGQRYGELQDGSFRA